MFLRIKRDNFYFFLWREGRKIKYYKHTKSLNTLRSITDLSGECSECWVLTKKFLGPSVEDLYVCKSLYHGVGESRMSSHSRIEGTHVYHPWNEVKRFGGGHNSILFRQRGDPPVLFQSYVTHTSFHDRSGTLFYRLNEVLPDLHHIFCNGA